MPAPNEETQRGFLHNVAAQVVAALISTVITAGGLWGYHELKEPPTAPTRTVQAAPVVKPAPGPVKVVQPATQPRPAVAAANVEDPMLRLFDLITSLIPFLVAPLFFLVLLRVLLGF